MHNACSPQHLALTLLLNAYRIINDKKGEAQLAADPILKPAECFCTGYCLWSFLVQQVEKCVERESGHTLCHYDEQVCFVSCDSGDRWAVCQQLYLSSSRPLIADRLSLKPFMCVISFWAQLCRIGPSAPHCYLLESFLIVVPGWPFQEKGAARLAQSLCRALTPNHLSFDADSLRKPPEHFA